MQSVLVVGAMQVANSYKAFKVFSIPFLLFSILAFLCIFLREVLCNKIETNLLGVHSLHIRNEKQIIWSPLAGITRGDQLIWSPLDGLKKEDQLVGSPLAGLTNKDQLVGSPFAERNKL